MLIKGTTQLLGVIGYPVEHSFSPLMHNAAIAYLNPKRPCRVTAEAQFRLCVFAFPHST